MFKKQQILAGGKDRKNHGITVSVLCQGKQFTYRLSGPMSISNLEHQKSISNPMFDMTGMVLQP